MVRAPVRATISLPFLTLSLIDDMVAQVRRQTARSTDSADDQVLRRLVRSFSPRRPLTLAASWR